MDESDELVFTQTTSFAWVTIDEFGLLTIDTLEESSALVGTRTIGIQVADSNSVADASGVKTDTANFNIIIEN